jgi:hypothetical protein
MISVRIQIFFVLLFSGQQYVFHSEVYTRMIGIILSREVE